METMPDISVVSLLTDFSSATFPFRISISVSLTSSLSMAGSKPIPKIYCFTPLDCPNPSKYTTPRKLRKIAGVESLRGPAIATGDLSKAAPLFADTEDGAAAVRETYSKTTSSEERAPISDVSSQNWPPVKSSEPLPYIGPLASLNHSVGNHVGFPTSTILQGLNTNTKQSIPTTKHLLPSVSSTEEKAPSQAVPEGTPEYEQNLSLHASCLPESCCIVDLRLPGCPVTFTSFDMLPSEQLQETELWYLEKSVDESSFQLINVQHGSEEFCNVILRGDLLERVAGMPSHQYVIQVNVTRVLQAKYSATPDEDVWLSIAGEELNKTCTKTSRNPTTVCDSPPLSTHGSMVDHYLSMIRSSYKNSFVLGVNPCDAMKYDITHVSSRLQRTFQSHNMTLRSAFPRDAGRIVGLLSLGEKFITNARMLGYTETEWICAVPMFGPQLSCWLCFFITTIYNE